MEKIKEKVNKLGQLEIEISHYTEEWAKKYNGTYTLEKVGWKHRKIATKFIAKMQSSTDLNRVAEEVVKKRNDGKTRVVHVLDMLKNNGEGLTDEEKTMFNEAVSGMDIEDMYGDDATDVILTFLVESPVPLQTKEEIEENLDLGTGKYIFEKCLQRLVENFQLDMERQKK